MLRCGAKILAICEVRVAYKGSAYKKGQYLEIFRKFEILAFLEYTLVTWGLRKDNRSSILSDLAIISDIKRKAF